MPAKGTTGKYSEEERAAILLSNQYKLHSDNMTGLLELECLLCGIRTELTFASLSEQHRARKGEQRKRCTHRKTSPRTSGGPRRPARRAPLSYEEAHALAPRLTKIKATPGSPLERAIAKIQRLAGVST